ncbi:hypothetical protein FLHKCMKP_CDS0060 [Escherichia phage KS_A3]
MTFSANIYCHVCLHNFNVKHFIKNFILKLC